MRKILLVITIFLFMFQINALSYSTIDAGNAAINRAGSVTPRTYVDRLNTANASGVITSIEIWCDTNLLNCEVATFSAIGNSLTTRDYESIGTVTSGAKRTFSVTLNVIAGDSIGLVYSSGGIERDTGSQGYWYTDGDQIPCTGYTFTVSESGGEISLYATGETVPDQVTNVQATDGVHTDKVAVTWNTASGADKYYCWNGSSWIDRGTNTSYDHTTAPAPTITAGTATASDGTSSDHVTLSIAGESANNGSSVDYKVRAYNTAGYGTESSTDAGYRGVGSLTYQWERSSGDADEDYSEIDGATTDPYNDTGAPANGDGRYYRCVENATGAAQQTTNADRGYRAIEEEEEANVISFGTNF